MTQQYTPKRLLEIEKARSYLEWCEDSLVNALGWSDPPDIRAAELALRRAQILLYDLENN